MDGRRESRKDDKKKNLSKSYKEEEVAKSHDHTGLEETRHIDDIQTGE